MAGPASAPDVKQVVEALNKIPGVVDVAAPATGFESYELTSPPKRIVDMAIVATALLKTPGFTVKSVVKKVVPPAVPAPVIPKPATPVVPKKG